MSDEERPPSRRPSVDPTPASNHTSVPSLSNDRVLAKNNDVPSQPAARGASFSFGKVGSHVISRDERSWIIDRHSFEIRRQFAPRSERNENAAMVFATHSEEPGQQSLSQFQDFARTSRPLRPLTPSSSESEVQTSTTLDVFPRPGSRISLDERLKNHRVGLAASALGALGVVFGDIGTSPLYTVQTIFASDIPADEDHVTGAISALFWLLNIIVTLKYVTVIMRADNHGQGGIMALTTLASQSKDDLARPWWKTLIIFTGMFGASMFFGDSMITPALSVMSAFEGVAVISPALTGKTMPMAVAVLIVLFLIQRFGTGAVGRAFGPVMIIWFGTLTATGITAIVRYPAVLHALNPARAVAFLQKQNAAARLFPAVGNIILAVTGADKFQIPAVIIATLATIIASQAVITGCYSLASQAIQIGLLPKMDIRHTSATNSGRIYVPAINWILMVGVVLLCFGFRSAVNLSSAYGMAVALTMTIDGCLTAFVGFRHFYKHGMKAVIVPFGLLMGGLFAVDVLLMAACALKFLQGAWFPIAIGLVFFFIMATWMRGTTLLLRVVRTEQPPLEPFITWLSTQKVQTTSRTAVYAVTDASTVPRALLQNLKHYQVLHAHNIFLCVNFLEQPTVRREQQIQVEQLAPTFWRVIVNYGFKDHPDIPEVVGRLEAKGLPIVSTAVTYFCTRSTVGLSKETNMLLSIKNLAGWRKLVFAFIMRNSSSPVDYYCLPSDSAIELASPVFL